jgi:hypothetical protein
MSGRWVLVELEEDLPAYRQVGLFYAFKLLPGVVSVTDLESISAETLDVFLLKPAPVTVTRPSRRIKQLDFMT